MFIGHFYQISVAASGNNILFTFLFILSKLSRFTGHVALTPASCSLVCKHTCIDMYTLSSLARRKDVFVRLEIMQETTASGIT